MTAVGPVWASGRLLEVIRRAASSTDVWLNQALHTSRSFIKTHFALPQKCDSYSTVSPHLSAAVTTHHLQHTESNLPPASPSSMSSSLQTYVFHHSHLQSFGALWEFAFELNVFCPKLIFSETLVKACIH